MQRGDSLDRYLRGDQQKLVVKRILKRYLRLGLSHMAL
jgi:hypothetical protein